MAFFAQLMCLANIYLCTLNFSLMEHKNPSACYVDLAMVSKSEMAYYANEDLCIVTDIHPNESIHSIRMGDILLVFCREGSLRINLNGKEQQLNSMEALVCLPSTLLSNAVKSPDFKGGMVFISKHLLRTSTSSAYDQLSKFFYLKENPIISLNEACIQTSQMYLNIILEKIRQKDAPYQKEIINSLMRAYLFELLSCTDLNTSPDEEYPRSFSQGERLVKDFLQMLGSDEVKQRFVTDYASRLCVTPKYLSAVCKNVTGKTASHWIDEFVVLEARHLLLNTDKTIKEIAQQLGFPNLSFFGKYIKAQLGTSPTNFRMSARRKAEQ